MDYIELYNVFKSVTDYDEKRDIWMILKSADKYKFLDLLMKSKDNKSITFLMAMDYITFEQHLFLIELNHDYKNDFEFIDHDTALQLFKPRLLDKKFLFNYIFTYINESKHVFKISNSEHLTKFKPILIQIYKNYNSKFGRDKDIRASGAGLPASAAKADAPTRADEVIFDDRFNFLSSILNTLYE